MNFIPCRVVAHDSETATVELTNGCQLKIADRHGLEGECVVAVRPEDITLSRTGAVECRIEVRNYLGNLIDYKISAGTQIIRVQTANTAVYEEGAGLTFTIERASLLPSFEARQSRA
jgi:ABC-type Fe3+/spermidine/putrescine transport system ATPase subunit